MPLTLRFATMADAKLVREWRNDPDVRAMSSDTREIGEAEHHRWMKACTSWHSDKAPDPYRILYIAEVDGVPVGTGRTERAWLSLSVKTDACQVGYSVAKEHRGKGYGKQLVAALVREAKGMGFSTVRCRIRRGNLKSVVCAMCAGVNAVEFF